MTGRQKEIIRHLCEGDLDRLLTRADDEKVNKRFTFLKRLYRCATSKKQLTMLECPNQPTVVGPDSGIRMGSGF